MIRQSQEYFAAAVSAAALNMAAVAAFVVFTMLASSSGFPLQDLFSSGNSITPASSSTASGDGEAPPSDSVIRSFGSRSAFGAAGGSGAPGGSAATANINQPDGTGPRSVGSLPGGSAGTTPGGGGTGAVGGGSGSAAGGSSGGGGDGAPTTSQPSGPGQQIGDEVSQAPSTINQSVNNAVNAADDATGGGLSQSGAKGPAQGANNSLLGQGSAVDQAAKNVGAALQAATNRVATAPSVPVSAPKLPASAPPLG